MKIEKTFPCVSVDTGGVCVADLGWLRRQGATDAGADIKVEKGVYEVYVTVHECWLGKVSVKAVMKIGSGGLFVGDPCSAGFDDASWDRLLAGTGYFENIPKLASGKILYAGTGGDGGFKVTVSLERITDLDKGVEITMPMRIDRRVLKRQRLALGGVIPGHKKLKPKDRDLLDGLLEMLHLIEDHCETIQERK